MKEVVSISRLQSMNGVRKRKKSQHLKGKGSKGGGGNRNTYHVFDYFFFSYFLSNPNSDEHVKPFKVEIENCHRFSDLSSHTNSLITALRLCQKK